MIQPIFANRLKLLCNFYNLLKSGTKERFEVLIAIIEYARDTKQVGIDQAAAALSGADTEQYLFSFVLSYV